MKLGERPEAPVSLNVAAKNEWNRIVDAMPSDWFTEETLTLLATYCEHVAEASALQTMIDRQRKKLEKNDDWETFDRYKKLLSARQAETRAILSCATKLRITHQSTYTNKSARTAKGRRDAPDRPWQQ